MPTNVSSYSIYQRRPVKNGFAHLPLDRFLETVTARSECRDAFDPALDAVVLRSYDAVAAALDESRLVPLGQSGTGVGRTTHLAVRAAARDAFPKSQLGAWFAPLEPSARGYATNAAARQSIDLVADFAEPWSLELAAATIGDAGHDPPRLAILARTIFLDAAHTRTGETSAEARRAASELSTLLRCSTSPGTAIDVQSFVALSQTLPCFLASAWLALFTHAEVAESLRATADVAAAIDELLRLSGPSRAVFRQALTDVRVASVQIGAGQRVVLELSAANRDPARFAAPDRLDLSRDATRHLALGAGSHSCVGAAIVRSAAQVATRALLAAIPRSPTIASVEWIDGFALRAPSSLTVTFGA